MKKELIKAILDRIEAKTKGGKHVLPEGVTLRVTVDTGEGVALEGIRSVVLGDEVLEAEDDKGVLHFILYQDVKMLGAVGLGRKSRPGFA